MSEVIKHDLTIRLDEENGKLIFFTTRKVPTGKPEQKQSFAVEIDLSDLNSRGVAGAERLIGYSVLGFFDHLTDGRLKLPKNYRDE